MPCARIWREQYMRSGEYDLSKSTYLTGFANPSGVLPGLQDLDRTHPQRRPRSRLTIPQPYPPTAPRLIFRMRKSLWRYSRQKWRVSEHYWRVRVIASTASTR